MENKSSASSSNPPLRPHLRFKPKAPPAKKTPKPAAPKTEILESANFALSSELLKLVKEEQQGNRAGRNEKKCAPVQVAFGYGQTSSHTNKKSTSVPRFASGRVSNQQPSSTEVDGRNNIDFGSRHKEYEEPFNYSSYYPVSLPLRRPYSGDPDVLNSAEFGEDSAALNVYDEESINPAVELDLLERNEEPQMLFFHLPASLPLFKRSATAAVKEEENNAASTSFRQHEAVGMPCKLEDLRGGVMGKMLVYENGEIKMKLGDILYNVTPGMSCAFPQDVAAINVREKQCCNLGELNKRAILTPDIDTFFQ